MPFACDALSMPVHWFYRTSDIYRYFPPHGICNMQAHLQIFQVRSCHYTRLRPEGEKQQRSRCLYSEAESSYKITVKFAMSLSSLNVGQFSDACDAGHLHQMQEYSGSHE